MLPRLQSPLRGCATASPGSGELWIEPDWESPSPALALIDEFLTAVRPRDAIALHIATGPLSETEAAQRLACAIADNHGPAAREGRLADVLVDEGALPPGVDVLAVDTAQRLAQSVRRLRDLRRSRAVGATVTPVMNRAEWMARWRPQPGLHPLVVDNASVDDTVELARAAGAEVVVQPAAIGRVENWVAAAEHFHERTDLAWLKWHFAGDELLPGAADLLQDAAAAHPDARLIVSSFFFRDPDGSQRLISHVDRTRLLSPEESLALSAQAGNWFGPPLAHAVHRDVVPDLEFGSLPWVADWQACVSIAARHPVLYVAEPFGVFDTRSRQFFSAQEREVDSLVQELAMRQQSLSRLRQRSPRTPGLAQLVASTNAHAASALSQRVRESREQVSDGATPATPARSASGRSPSPVIAVHAPRGFDHSGRDFMGYAPEFAARYARYAYVPQLAGNRDLIACRRAGQQPTTVHGLEIITDADELNRVADILVCLEGRPYRPELAPPRGFRGLKAYHAFEFVFHAMEANEALVAGGVDVVLGYCRHDEYSPFFRALYPTFAGRTLAVPFGFAPRFAPTVPFEQRDPRAVGIGSVNPVDDPACPPGELDAYVAFHPGVRWTHGWRRMLSENRDALSDVLDARFPVYPQTKDLSYDAVAALNDCMMFVNDPGLMAFPPARTYEGPACGAVLVGEDSAVHRDLGFVDGENALLHRPGDCEDFARVVREARSEPAALARMARAGRELVGERYTHEAVARTLHEQLCAVHAGR